VDAITQESLSETGWDAVAFDNSYARLPEAFHTRLDPTPVSNPRLVKVNTALAEAIGIDPEILTSADSASVLAGNQIPEKAEPLAMVYAGHQFGNWVPRLGDGRAILLGEVMGPDGIRRDIQLKGSGPTPYSRMGDGRAVLGPVMREYIVSEAMAGLGIRTSRALAMATTGEIVRREGPEPGAILTRVAASHIRVGTFQYFHGQRDEASIRTLAEHVIDRHYPAAREAEDPYLALLEAVALNTAELIGSWMLVGFIHGVMNTDNCTISGETIDYGPCAFIDTFHPETVFSSIDTGGRYAYDQQPSIGLWNVTRLAETLLVLFDENQDTAIEKAKQALAGYWPRFEQVFHGGLCAKIGLPAAEKPDFELALDLLGRMANQQADFTLTFRRLSDAPAGDIAATAMVRMLFDDPTVYDEWDAKWRQRFAGDGIAPTARRAAMRAVNPAFIPRNHQVQRAIDFATQAEDFGPMEELLSVVVSPFEDHPGQEHLALPPTSDQAVTQTFCGT
jgi:uncharacterized protein YdiU (UPF0061 family)